MAKIKNDKTISTRFVSKAPITLYIVCITILLLLIYLLINRLNILMALFDCAIVTGLIYYFFLRGISRLSISRNLIIQQSFWSKKKRIIRFDSIESYQYYRSGYCFWSTETKSRVVEKPYDELFLTLKYKDERREEVLKINIRYGEFRKIIALFNYWYPIAEINHKKDLFHFYN